MMSSGRCLLSAALVGIALAAAAEIEVKVKSHPTDSNSSPTLAILSQVPGEIKFSLMGKGFLRSHALITGASMSYSVNRPGSYQYKITAGAEQTKGILELAAGQATELVLTGTGKGPPAPPGEKETISYNPQAGGKITIRNPFGPAFDKLSIEEKIRLVQETPEAQSLSPPERLQLMAVLYNEKGVQEAAAKRFPEAEESLRKAHQNLPQEPTVRQNLAFAVAAHGNELRQDGNLPSGEKKLLEALELLGGGDPNLAGQIRSALAALYVEEGLTLSAADTKRRAVFFQKALAQDPAHAGALFHLGEVAYQEYNLETALGYFERAQELSPQEDLAILIEQVRREIEEAGDFETQNQGTFRISFEGRETRPLARATRRLLNEAEREVGRKFDLHPQGTISVVIYSGGQFQQIFQLHSWVGGAYDGKIRLPIGDLSIEDFDQGKDQIRKLIHHEYTHALLHNRTAPAKLPIWLHEGLAQVAAEEKPGLPILRRAVREGIASGRLPLPSKMVGDFAGIADPQIAKQLYVESFLFTEFLVERQGGWAHIKSLIENIAAGVSLEDSFTESYRKGLPDLEDLWLGSLRRN
jgi:tetratricopeptide (TPR) repeat protein